MRGLPTSQEPGVVWNCFSDAISPGSFGLIGITSEGVEKRGTKSLPSGQLLIACAQKVEVE
jgi:hypothetical protein